MISGRFNCLFKQLPAEQLCQKDGVGDGRNQSGCVRNAHAWKAISVAPHVWEGIWGGNLPSSKEWGDKQWITEKSAPSLWLGVSWTGHGCCSIPLAKTHHSIQKSKRKSKRLWNACLDWPIFSCPWKRPGRGTCSGRVLQRKEMNMKNSFSSSLSLSLSLL